MPAPLTCQATASLGSGTAPVDVSFSASAAGGSTGYTYHWNFGDGKSADGQQATHTYKSGGKFTWRMTVTDMGRQTCSKSAPIKILAPLTVSATASPRQGASPLTVTFTATAKGAKPPYAYLWDFGDGATAVTATATHTFAAQGAYRLHGDGHRHEGHKRHRPHPRLRGPAHPTAGDFREGTDRAAVRAEAYGGGLPERLRRDHRRCCGAGNPVQE